MSKEKDYGRERQEHTGFSGQSRGGIAWKKMSLGVLCSVGAPESCLISVGMGVIFTDTQIHRDSWLPCSSQRDSGGQE